MTIEELKNNNNSYILVDADAFNALMHLKEFSKDGLQGWTVCPEEEAYTSNVFIELVTSYLNMVSKLSEPLVYKND